MELTEQQHYLIRQKLQGGNSKNDLVELINIIIDIQNRQLKTTYRKITLSEFGYFLSKRDSQYVQFEIPKKTSGSRKITAPKKGLKKIQRRIAFALETLFDPSRAVNGFVNSRSIVTNALPHLNKKFVYNLDLKDFFPSIHYGRIKAVLKLSPINASESMAHLIAHIACFEGVLPQGSPLSPLLTNLVCQSLDSSLEKMAEDYNCTYSRYADDITFSSNKVIFQNKFINRLHSTIAKQGFSINKRKTRLQNYYQRQEVTGIIVNEKLSINRSDIKKIRAMLYNWENKGLDYCQRQLELSYPSEKRIMRKGAVPEFQKVINGKINFLGMVRGKEDVYSKRFKSKYEELANRE